MKKKYVKPLLEEITVGSVSMMCISQENPPVKPEEPSSPSYSFGDANPGFESLSKKF